MRVHNLQCEKSHVGNGEFPVSGPDWSKKDVHLDIPSIPWFIKENFHQYNEFLIFLPFRGLHSPPCMSLFFIDNKLDIQEL